MKERGGHQENVEIVNDGLNESVDKGSPREVVNRLEFVINIKLRRHSDESSHPHEEDKFL